MTELKYKHELMALLRGLKFKVQDHEDMIQPYIPDLSFSFARTDGWIEVKYLPKAPTSLSAIKHYTHGQQQWLVNRGMVGSGHCYLLVGTPDMHYLWRWSSLGAARDEPWDRATIRAMGDSTLAGLCRGLAAVVQHSRR